MKLPWKPHTERPAKVPCTAFIAIAGDDGEFFIHGGIFEMTAAGVWCDDQTGEPMSGDVYYWLDEDVLTQSVNEVAKG